MRAKRAFEGYCDRVASGMEEFDENHSVAIELRAAKRDERRAETPHNSVAQAKTDDKSARAIRRRKAIELLMGRARRAESFDVESAGRLEEHAPSKCDVCLGVLVCRGCRDAATSAFVGAMRALFFSVDQFEVDEVNEISPSERLRAHLANLDAREGRPALLSGTAAICEGCGAGWILSDVAWHAWSYFNPGSNERWVAPHERIAGEALKSAQLAASLSQDPLAHDAFEVIKIALDTIAGNRRLPLDALDRLSAQLKGNERAQSSENETLRHLYELLERRVEIIAPSEGRSRGSVTTEAPLLHRDLVAAHGEAVGKNLSIDECRDILGRLVAGPRSGTRLTISGGVVEVVARARLLPGISRVLNEHERRELLQRLSKARTLGTATARVRKARKKRRKGVVGRRATN